MTQEELDALPDVTPRFVLGIRTIDGRRVRVPIQQVGVGALFDGPGSGQFICQRTGRRYLVGEQNGVMVKRISDA